MFHVFADGAGLCADNNADIVVTFALGNPEENLGFARRQLERLESLDAALDRTRTRNSSSPSLTENVGTKQQDSYAILRISKNRERGENPHTMKTTVLETINERKIKLMKNRSSLTIFTTILSVLACVAFLPRMQAAPQVAPPPDGCYPGFTTAEGCKALQFLGAGAGNTGVGWYSLFFAGDSNFSTGVGAGTLVLNTADSNTAVGAAALLLNTTGTENVAVGTDALVFNDSGSDNNAFGAFALFNNNASFNNAHGRIALTSNVDGEQNEAFGDRALRDNVSGSRNTAIGDDALLQNTVSDNTALGNNAGSNIIDATDNMVVGSGAGSNIVSLGGNIYIGSGAGGATEEIAFIRIGTPTILGFPYDTYIAGIKDRSVELATAAFVFVDANQKLGTNLVDANGNKVATPQAMLNEVLKAQTRVAELEGTVERLAATVKEQAAQIQKVSAQLEVSKPASQTVVNNP
jgi:hypothetical protein